MGHLNPIETDEIPEPASRTFEAGVLFFAILATVGWIVVFGLIFGFI